MSWRPRCTSGRRPSSAGPASLEQMLNCGCGEPVAVIAVQMRHQVNAEGHESAPAT